MPPTKSLTTAQRRLRLTHLDQRLAKFADVPQPPIKEKGWIRAIRTALGMTSDQLATRLNITQQAASALEQDEDAGNITLKRLRKVAEALECQFVYGFVPVNGTLDEHRHRQARIAAERLVTRVESTMALENQSRVLEMREADIKEIAEDLYRTFSRELWAEPEKTVSGKSEAHLKRTGRLMQIINENGGKRLLSLTTCKIC